jgi:putative endopeptidase
MKNQIFVLAVGATLLFNSCENKPELVSGISKENMNLKVKPGDNFEEYVNGTWLKKNKIPADMNT